MRKEIIIEKSLRKWNFYIRIYRIFYEEKKPVRLDVLFFFTIGFGNMVNSFNKGFMFYIDFLNFNVNELYKAHGFSLPIGNILDEKMICKKCGNEFYRWRYYKCPKCDEPH